MFAHLRMLLSVLSFWALTTNTDPGETQDDDLGEKKPPKVEFTDEQNEEINRIVARATQKAAEKAKSERDDEIAAEKAAAEAEAQRKADEEAGKFEDVKKSLIGERDTAKSALETAEAERDKALEILKANVDDRWKDMPESVRKTYAGDENDVLAKSGFMQQMQPIIDELAEKAGKPAAGGNRPNPGAVGGDLDLNEAMSKARKSGRYRA